MKEILAVLLIVLLILSISIYGHRYKISQGQKIIYSKVNYRYIWVDKDGKP